MIRKLSIAMGCLAWVFPAPAAVVTRGPYLQAAGADRMTVCWRTDEATTSELSFGLALDSMSAPLTMPGTRFDHAVTLTGLQATTRYFYRVGGADVDGSSVDVGGADYWFRTAPTSDSEDPVRIWVAGDSGYLFGAAEMAFANFMASSAALGKSTEVFLLLGDNAYPWGADSNYQSALFNRYAPLIRATPMWSAIGNHDVSIVPENHPPAPYFSIFHFPESGECGGVASGTESYYSFDHGNIHFICLDTNTTVHISDAPGGPYGMIDWLEDDLKACSSDWIIAFSHQGPYTKGSHDSDTEAELVKTRQYVVPLLEEYGVDLVLCGHSHVYERSRMIDGHYGVSSTWNALTMNKWEGNGSVLGGVDPMGDFVLGEEMAGGAYQKPAALGHSGTIYVVAGASSSAQRWADGSFERVNPQPHPAHEVSLNTIGNVIISTEGAKLNVQYRDRFDSIQDDFTLLKGSTYQVHGASPDFDSGDDPGVSFLVTRDGALGYPDQVSLEAEVIGGGAVTPSSLLLDFATGQDAATARFKFVGGQLGSRVEVGLKPTLRSVSEGFGQRSAYRMVGTPQIGQLASTPADTWYESRFGIPPANASVWEQDNDGDGLSLLMEYALGGEPGSDDSRLLPEPSIEGGMFQYRYRRPEGRTDLVYEILHSSDLVDWSGPELLQESDGPASASGTPLMVELDPSGLPSQFLRLVVTRQP